MRLAARTVAVAGGGAAAYSTAINANAFGYADEATANDANILGAKHVRVAVSLSDAATDLDVIFTKFWNHGCRVYLLAGDDLPTTANAAKVAAWASRFGPGGVFWTGKANPLPLLWIEMGNETFYSYKSLGTYASRGATYANGIAAARTAMNTAGTVAGKVGLIAQADGNDVAAINAMFTAQPTIASMVAGWSIHPYSPLTTPIAPWDSGRTFASLITQAQTWLSGNGVTVGPASPLFITEYGIASDNGTTLGDNYGWPKDLTYAQAATDLLAVDAKIRADYSRLIRMFTIYGGRDLAEPGANTNQENYFGALKLNSFSQDGGTPKGNYTTAVQSIMARGQA